MERLRVGARESRADEGGIEGRRAGVLDLEVGQDHQPQGVCPSRD